MGKLCPRCVADGYGEYEIIRLPEGTDWGDWRCPACGWIYFDSEV